MQRGWHVPDAGPGGAATCPAACLAPLRLASCLRWLSPEAGATSAAAGERQRHPDQPHVRVGRGVDAATAPGLATPARPLSSGTAAALHPDAAGRARAGRADRLPGRPHAQRLGLPQLEPQVIQVARGHRGPCAPVRSCGMRKGQHAAIQPSTPDQGVALQYAQQGAVPAARHGLQLRTCHGIRCSPLWAAWLVALPGAWHRRCSARRLSPAVTSCCVQGGWEHLQLLEPHCSLFARKFGPEALDAAVSLGQDCDRGFAWSPVCVAS